MEKRHTHHQFLTLSRSAAGRPKFTTRHLAALDFLLHVPMSAEADIRHSGIANASKAQQLEDNEGEESKSIDRELGDNESVDETSKEALFAHSLNHNIATNLAMSTDMTEDHLNNFPDFAGKKLKGPNPYVGKYPATIRHVLSRISDQSALCRQWEDQMLNKAALITSSSPADPSLLASRIFFSRARSYPLMVCSVIKYDAVEEKARIQKMKAEDQKGLEVFELPHRDWRGLSYKPLFKQMQEDGEGFLYDPDSLDDPNMLYGSHRYVSAGSAATGPILSSIILYVNKEELRESLNEQFHERHPNLPASLTLSKIRNIKKKILVFCVLIRIELSTVALAMINFERLCLKGFVSKINRKLSMAVSILLAFKFSENYSHGKDHKTMEQLLDYFDKDWDLPRKQVLEAEFGAYVHLGFNLHVPYQHLHLMYSRLLKLINKTSKQYLGEEMHDRMVQDILTVEREKEYRSDRDKSIEDNQQSEQVSQQQQQQHHQQPQTDVEEERSERNTPKPKSFWSIGKISSKRLGTPSESAVKQLNTNTA